MADWENQGPAEQSQLAAAEMAMVASTQEMPAEGGAQGCAGAGDPGAAREAEEPRSPAAEPHNEFVQSLPSVVRCRVLALQRLQRHCDKIEACFDEEFRALEVKYTQIFKPLLAKIRELKGEVEGCAWNPEAEVGNGAAARQVTHPGTHPNTQAPDDDDDDDDDDGHDKDPEKDVIF